MVVNIFQEPGKNKCRISDTYEEELLNWWGMKYFMIIITRVGGEWAFYHPTSICFPNTTPQATSSSPGDLPKQFFPEKKTSRKEVEEAQGHHDNDLFRFIHSLEDDDFYREISSPRAIDTSACWEYALHLQREEIRARTSWLDSIKLRKHLQVIRILSHQQCRAKVNTWVDLMGDN